MDTLRYGIVGAGLMGVEHVCNLLHLPGAEVTAVADPNEASLAQIAAVADLHVPGTTFATFTHHDELAASGLCDAVIVASPNMTHHDVVLDLLPTGLHLLVEKPLCTTVEHCRDVIRAAEGREGIVWVGLEYRYMPPVARLIRTVHRGDLGRLRMIGIREHRYPFLPKIGDWNRFNENTGGTLVEKCCHFFDLMNHLVGADPVRVMASGAQDVNHLDERYDGRIPDILDNAMVVVDYVDGVRASLDLCMFAEGSTNAEELYALGDEAKAEAFLPSKVFRLGRRAEGHEGVVEEVVTNPAVRYEGFHYGSSFLEHLDFAAACRAGSTPQVSLRDGLRSVALGVAAQRSAAEHRVVELAELDAP